MKDNKDDKIIQISKYINKTNLNKIIKWSPSRYCEHKKADIIKKVLSMKCGDKFTCHTGSYTSSNGWGWGYTFTRTERYLLIEDIGGTVEVLECKGGTR